jgi:hypothetical protein
MSKWISGHEVMDTYRIAPVELGRDCFDGLLTAFHRDLLEPIYDMSQLPRVPKYPPVGVDKMDHIQTGERVEWNWEIIQGVDKLRAKLQQAESLIGQAEAVCKEKDTRSLMTQGVGKYFSGMAKAVPEVDEHNPFRKCTFEEATHCRDKLVTEAYAIKNEIYQKTEVKGNALLIAQERVEELGCHPDEVYSKAQKYAWDKLMPIEHFWLVNGELLEHEDLDSRLFFFDFAMFKRLADFVAKITSGGKASEEQALASYKQHISAMLFGSTSVEGWVQAPSPSNPAKQASPTDTPLDSLPVAKAKKYTERGEISQEAAGKRIGKSARTIKRWCAGEGRVPDGFPGLSNAYAFDVWATQYAYKTSPKGMARAMSRPTSGGGVGNEARDWGDDPEG